MDLALTGDCAGIVCGYVPTFTKILRGDEEETLPVVAAALAAFLAGPLAAIVAQSVEDRQGGFAGLDNFFAYFGTPALAPIRS